MRPRMPNTTRRKFLIMNSRRQKSLARIFVPPKAAAFCLPDDDDWYLLLISTASCWLTRFAWSSSLSSSSSLFSIDQKVQSCMMAGNMIARQLDASAPISAMKRSNRGMSAAATTAHLIGSSARVVCVIIIWIVLFGSIQVRVSLGLVECSWLSRLWLVVRDCGL